ncbi:Scr1 family TA system antitoxin-like transcriptional regulator [Nonomuraea purpurea]|uniref:Scr1 family TA system antitoxin-like transcriptional regulator n=1 Tax=Nonomuraea purpurea TaxID=1849276 RepID=A0ABV8G1C6_9ACTN
MPSSPSSSAQEARRRLAAQLRDLRAEARITGREFAQRAGWADATTVTKIENARRTITPDHIRLWCRICGASGQREAELLAEQRMVIQMWISYRELGWRVGLNATQKMGTGDLFERLSVFRSYQTKLPHGLLQTQAFMTGVLLGVREERHVEVDDVAEAVAERMSRQRFLRTHRRFLFIVEEAVLRYSMFSHRTHREQLQHLLQVMGWPSISFGVIPMSADRSGYRVRESFELVDDDKATIELISGFLSLTHSDEVAMYAEAWDRLAALAVHGDQARALVLSALAAFDDQEDL